MRYQTTTAVTLLALGTAGAHADVINVPADAPTIQVALNLASDGDEVVVAPGTYFETIDLLGKAVTLRSSQGPDVTTIDALGQLDSAIHCTSGEGSDTVIAGFTVRNGDATGAPPEERGGGIYIDVASPVITDCVFIENTANIGGALYVNAGSPALSHCRFVANMAISNGGALYLNNATTAITSCSFEGNEALDNVGGAIRTQTGNTTIVDSVFQDNTSVTYGGAIAFVTSSRATVLRTSFVGNFSGDGGSSGRGGAISTGSGTIATIQDSVFVDNSCTRFGGALYAANPMTVLGSTLTGNTTASGSEGVYGGGTASTFANVIAWDNGSGPINGNARITYSTVQGGFAGAGNIDTDPMFMNAADGDLRLQPESPCVDAGDTTRLSGAYPVDFDGALRAVNDPAVQDTGITLLNLAVDMGAFERQVEGGPDTCPSDLDDSGTIDFGDVLRILSDWGPCPE